MATTPKKKKKQQPLNVKHLGFPSVAISLVLLSFFLSFPFRFSVSSSVRSCVCARACVSCFFTLSVCWSIVGFLSSRKKNKTKTRKEQHTHTHKKTKKYFVLRLFFFVRVCARWGLLLLLFAPPLLLLLPQLPPSRFCLRETLATPPRNHRPRPSAPSAPPPFPSLPTIPTSPMRVE